MILLLVLSDLYFAHRLSHQALQVWFVKQDSLPCVDYKEGNAILLESPWKLAVAPTGNGGLFSALHAQNITDRLSEEGVQYVQVCWISNLIVLFPLIILHTSNLIQFLKEYKQIVYQDNYYSEDARMESSCVRSAVFLFFSFFSPQSLVGSTIIAAFWSTTLS